MGFNSGFKGLKSSIMDYIRPLLPFEGILSVLMSPGQVTGPSQGKSIGGVAEEKRGTTFRSSTDKIFKTPSWNNKTRLKKPFYQGKNRSREYSKENKTVPGKVATTHRGWTQTGYLNKHYNINQKDEDTQDDRGRDGGTNFILRIQGTGIKPNLS